MRGTRILPLLLAALLAGCVPRGESLRHLDGLGSIQVPRRLEDRSPERGPDLALFRFDRVADSFLLMGSNTPIRERMTVLVWKPGTVPDAQWTAEFRATAIERVQDLRWRREGDLELGEGTHRVNTHESRARVVLHQPASGPVWIGYMAWDTDLEEARRVVQKASASFAR